METRTVTTALIGKEEIFKMLALAESLQMPILLEGKPGTGKTNTVLDYMAGKYKNYDEAINNTFIIETDESTKAGEVKGRLSLKSMFEHKKWEMDSPISRASAVLINEVDKANSGCRNGLLSVMRERKIFNGNEAPIDCVWEAFIGTCNEIPKDEVDSPFWDRFVLKAKVDRVSPRDLVKYMTNGSKVQQITLQIPTKAEIDAIQLDEKNLAMFVDMVHSALTDRTITTIAKLTKAIMLVYAVDESTAMLKTCSFLSPGHVMKLTPLLEDKAIVEVSTKIQSLGNLTDKKVIMQEMGNIALAFEDLKINRKDLAKKISTLEQEYKRVIKNNDAVRQVATLIGEEIDA